MKRPASVRKAGPYEAVSISNGKIMVTPAWPAFPPWTEEDGGGPGLFSRVGLAADLKRWLNSIYPPEDREERT